ncbi:MAG: hypothetical protein RMM58_03690 [Chloroflexota bacterium]|nr:hypothetical protein [Dehalococcoidia bacterium]MDW8252963.1 hypothetical protein [Chloroflexota bacterium]
MRAFWEWYNRHYLANLIVSTGIFLLQLIHLYWLTGYIVDNLFGWRILFIPESSPFYAIPDYLEIPTLVSVSLLYLNQLRSAIHWRPLLYLLLLNTQYIHIFWITDELVVKAFAEQSIVTWNGWVAWIAIAIDYLEVPVIIDTLRQVWNERATILAKLRGVDVGELTPAAD